MDSYEQLFEDFVAEMRVAQAAAQAWWVKMQIREQLQGNDVVRANELLERRWPMGAVSHPAVIATFRKWALQCQALNDAVDDDDEDTGDEDDESDDSDWGCEDEEGTQPQDLDALEAPVEPRELLIEMLPGRADDLAEFLADFVFTPLGLDKNDRWI